MAHPNNTRSDISQSDVIVIRTVFCCANENCARHYFADKSDAQYNEQFCSQACENEEKYRLLMSTVTYQDEQNNRVRHYEHLL